MDPWLWAALGLCLALVPCALVCLGRGPADRLVGLELSGNVVALIMLCLAQAFERTVYLDLAVALSLLSFAGGLVFAHFLERWV